MTNLISYIDFWFYIIGVNIIPIRFRSKQPIVSWEQWQNEAIPEELYEKWKNGGLFDNGYAIITGKILRGDYKDKYLVCIDIDNKKGLDEFLSCFSQTETIDELSKKTFIVQHLDAQAEKAHFYYICDKAITKKCGISSTVRKDEAMGAVTPSIEVKSDSSTIMVGPGSTHKNGYPYESIGTKNIEILDEEKTSKLEETINQIYNKYSDKINHHGKTSLPSIKQMDEDDYVVYEGNNRHLNLLRKIDSWYSKSDKTLTFDELYSRANKYSEKHFDPPLSEKEVSDLVKQSMGWVDEKNVKSKLIKSNKEDVIQENSDKYLDKQVIIAKIPDKAFADFIINTAKKTIKREDPLIRLILYTGLSAYTKDPLNLGILAPTSEGKTYAVTEVIINFFPKQDVWILGNMTPKVLIRDRGILVDNNNQPIKGKIQQLNKAINETKDKDEKEELEEELKTLYENSKILIDLSNKTLVFLEPPHPETWIILKPILSHDTLEIEHPYVYQADKRLVVKHIVTRGWPACIFCSARDDSSWRMWPEIQSRFFIVSPNMIRQKYKDSNTLIAQKKGLPPFVQEQLIVSKEDIDLAKDCILILRKELLSNLIYNVWIPFYSILSESLPSEKGSDVRIAGRIYSLLNLITKINSINRPKLIIDDERLAITLLSDLEEVLKLTHNITGIPSYKLDFLTDIFVPLYLSKEEPLSKGDVVEDMLAVYTNEIAAYYKERKGKSLTADNIRKTYLYELKNNGLIDDFKSIVDKRMDGYYPIVDLDQYKSTKTKNRNCTNLTNNDNNFQFFRLKLPNNYNNIDDKWLELQILELLKYGIGKVNIFKLVDKDDNQTCICQFVKNYNISGNLNLYFQSDENCIYSSKIFGKVIKIE